MLQLCCSPASLISLLCGNGYSLMEDNEICKIEIRSLIILVVILAELTSQLSIRLITVTWLKSPEMSVLLIPQPTELQYIFSSLWNCRCLNLPRGSGWSQTYCRVHYGLYAKPSSSAAISERLAYTLSLCPFYIFLSVFSADTFTLRTCRVVRVVWCGPWLLSLGQLWTAQLYMVFFG